MIPALWPTRTRLIYAPIAPCPRQTPTCRNSASLTATHGAILVYYGCTLASILAPPSSFIGLLEYLRGRRPGESDHFKKEKRKEKKKGIGVMIIHSSFPASLLLFVIHMYTHRDFCLSRINNLMHRYIYSAIIYWLLQSRSLWFLIYFFYLFSCGALQAIQSHHTLTVSASF